MPDLGMQPSCSAAMLFGARKDRNSCPNPSCSPHRCSDHSCAFLCPGTTEKHLWDKPAPHAHEQGWAQTSGLLPPGSAPPSSVPCFPSSFRGSAQPRTLSPVALTPQLSRAPFAPLPATPQPLSSSTALATRQETGILSGLYWQACTTQAAAGCLGRGCGDITFCWWWPMSREAASAGACGEPSYWAVLFLLDYCSGDLGAVGQREYREFPASPLCPTTAASPLINHHVYQRFFPSPTLLLRFMLMFSCCWLLLCSLGKLKDNLILLQLRWGCRPRWYPDVPDVASMLSGVPPPAAPQI